MADLRPLARRRFSSLHFSPPLVLVHRPSPQMLLIASLDGLYLLLRRPPYRFSG